MMKEIFSLITRKLNNFKFKLRKRYIKNKNPMLEIFQKSFKTQKSISKCLNEIERVNRSENCLVD